MRYSAKVYQLTVYFGLLTSACGEQNSGPESPTNTTASTSSDPSSPSNPDAGNTDADTTPGNQDSTSPQDPQSPEIVPTWENYGDAFLRNWCKGCHSPELVGAARFGAPEGVDLVTLADLRQWQSRVAARATGDAPSMPPAGGPSQEELLRLKQWLDLGAPENADLEAP